jgi:mannose-6-phosphate isomerase-like protein (cupin superfamily)
MSKCSNITRAVLLDRLNRSSSVTKPIIAAATAISMLASLPAAAADTPHYEVVEFDAVEWGALNPARGDASPRAGDLWGDRARDEASGFLVRFDEGFSSPPHIHNVTYRGIVIGGAIHNDDPEAAPMWLSPSSFWTQPAGEDHVTAARGAFNMAYIEIDSGPYLVRPSAEAFDNGERPINAAASNLVWLDGDDVTFLPVSDGSGAQTAFLWADRETGERGSLLRLPAGSSSRIATGAGTLRAVVTSAGIRYTNPQTTGEVALGAGSYFGSMGNAVHTISCEAEDDCLLYIRTSAAFTVAE